MNGMINFAGHSSVSEVLHWFGKACNSKSQRQVSMMKACEDFGGRRCHCCNMSSVTFKKVSEKDLLKCSRCHWLAADENANNSIRIWAIKNTAWKNIRYSIEWLGHWAIPSVGSKAGCSHDRSRDGDWYILHWLAEMLLEIIWLCSCRTQGLVNMASHKTPRLFT